MRTLPPFIRPPLPPVELTRSLPDLNDSRQGPNQPAIGSWDDAAAASAASPYTAQVPAGASDTGAIFWDLHPLETRLFDSVAKAHWRRTRGSRGNRFVGPIRAAALEVAALEAAAHEAAAHEAAVHEAAAIKAVVHVKVALEAAVASNSEHSVVRYGHSMRI